MTRQYLRTKKLSTFSSFLSLKHQHRMGLLTNDSFVYSTPRPSPLVVVRGGTYSPDTHVAM